MGLLLLSVVWAQDIQVSYLSQESVYLNVGSLAGLSEGDIVAAVANPSIELEVLYTSKYSSACKFLTEGQTLKTGDLVFIKIKRGLVETPLIEELPPPSVIKRSDMKISGYYNTFTNGSKIGQGLKLGIRSIANLRDLDLIFRGTDRACQVAQLHYSPTEGQSLWVGRFVPRDIVYLGTLDGGQASYCPTAGWTVGGIIGRETDTNKQGIYSKWDNLMVGVIHESSPSQNNINNLFYTTTLPPLMNWTINSRALYGNISDNQVSTIKQLSAEGTLKLSKTLQTGFSAWYENTDVAYYGLRLFGQIKEDQTQLGLSVQSRRNDWQKSYAVATTYQGRNIFIANSMFSARGDWSWSDDYYSLSGSAAIQQNCFTNHDLTVRVLVYVYKHTLSETAVFYPSLQLNDEIALLENWDLSISAEQYFGADAPPSSFYLSHTFYY